jgi:uncharacterized protein (DUF305 family)
MITFKKFVAATAVALALTAPAFAQQGTPGHDIAAQPDGQKSMDEAMPNPSDSPSTKAFKEAGMKMMKNMEVTFTGNTDVDFVRAMMPHHQGAIDMAKVELAHGKNPDMRKMAQKIIRDQEKEISQMQAWLKKNAK